MVRFVATTICLLLSAGCASVAAPPPYEAIAGAAIGPAPTGYEEAIKEHFASGLKDPYSAVYTFQRPVRAWEDGKVIWAVCGTVNAKNAYGGYVGARPFLAVVAGGRVMGAIDSYAYKYRESPLSEKCREWHRVGIYE